MPAPRSVREILDGHVSLEVEILDRVYRNAYVPKLQRDLGVVGYFRDHRGQPVASSALMAPMSRGFVRAIKDFVEDEDVALVSFRRGERKDDVAKRHLAHFESDEGVLFVGKAQEKVPVFRTEKRRGRKGRTYPWIVRSTAMVDQYYFYLVDRDFGPFFAKFSAYFPYTAKLCLNGHEYLKRQLAKEGIAVEALDNGILSCADPVRMQEIADGPSGEKIAALFHKWLEILPHAFTPEDRGAGYQYDLSILRAKFSLTQVLDHPANGPATLRGHHSGEPGSRPSRPGPDGLRPPPNPAHTRAVPYPRDHRRGHPLAPLLGLEPSHITPGRMTYDLRRLKLRGLIERIAGTHRYRLTHFGLRTALFFTRAYARIVRDGLTRMHEDDDAVPSALRASFRRVEQAMDEISRRQSLAA